MRWTSCTTGRWASVVRHDFEAGRVERLIEPLDGARLARVDEVRMLNPPYGAPVVLGVYFADADTVFGDLVVVVESHTVRPEACRCAIAKFSLPGDEADAEAESSRQSAAPAMIWANR